MNWVFLQLYVPQLKFFDLFCLFYLFCFENIVCHFACGNVFCAFVVFCSYFG